MAWVEGKAVVVTGGSSGIGKAVAFAVAAAGGRVAIAGRTPSRVEQAVEQVVQAGGEAIGVPTDVGDPTSVERLMEATVGAFGGIDGLVTAAGLGRVSPLLSQPLADVEETVRTDFLGTVNCVVSAARIMRPGAQVITVGSLMAGSSSGSMPVYAAVKTAVVNLSESIRGELASVGIRLSCVLPGSVATHFQDGWGAAEMQAFGMSGSAAGVPTEEGGPDLSKVMRARDIAPSVLSLFDLPERSRGATISIL